MTPPSVEEMLHRLMTNDIPHITSRLSGLEAQGRITIALVAGAISVLVGR